jgi:hypothetical protein
VRTLLDYVALIRRVLTGRLAEAGPAALQAPARR